MTPAQAVEAIKIRTKVASPGEIGAICNDVKSGILKPQDAVNQLKSEGYIKGSPDELLKLFKFLSGDNSLSNVAASGTSTLVAKFKNPGAAVGFLNAMRSMSDKLGLKQSGNDVTVTVPDDVVHLYESAKQIAKNWKGVTAKPASMSVAASAPVRTRAYDYSFANDLDRELYLTEVGRALSLLKPNTSQAARPKIDIWNASCTIWTGSPEVVAMSRKIASRYQGVSMSNRPVAVKASFDDDENNYEKAARAIQGKYGTDIAKAIPNVKEPQLLQALIDAANKSAASATQAGQPGTARIRSTTAAKATKALKALKKATGMSISASRRDRLQAQQQATPAVVPMSVDLTLPSDEHARKFAAAAILRHGGKVEASGSRVKYTFDPAHGASVMALASKTFGKPVQQTPGAPDQQAVGMSNVPKSTSLSLSTLRAVAAKAGFTISAARDPNSTLWDHWSIAVSDKTDPSVVDKLYSYLKSEDPSMKPFSGNHVPGKPDLAQYYTGYVKSAKSAKQLKADILSAFPGLKALSIKNLGRA